MFQPQPKTMSDLEVILHLSALALLVGVLVYLQGRRARQRERLRRQLRPVAEPINVATLRPRVAEVRQTFRESARAQARHGHARESLVAAARRQLARLPFFRSNATHPEHDAPAA
jgi:hypothetical protein